MTDGTIEKIHAIIRDLDVNKHSQDIVGISIMLNDLAIQSSWFAEQVSDAYTQMNDSEEEYKSKNAKYISESTVSMAKAEREGEVKFELLRKEWVTYKNMYQRFRSKLDRIDTILDTHRQRVSLLKQLDLKNI